MLGLVFVQFVLLLTFSIAEQASSCPHHKSSQTPTTTQKTALITGITGQDGSYLAEFLLEKGYKVVGLVRRTSLPSTYYTRIAHIQDRVTLVPGDLLDQSSLNSVIKDIDPDEVYNLAAQSFVATSFSQPETTGYFSLSSSQM